MLQVLIIQINTKYRLNGEIQSCTVSKLRSKISLPCKVMTCPVYHLKATCGVTGLLQVTFEQMYWILLKVFLDIKNLIFHVAI